MSRAVLPLDSIVRTGGELAAVGLRVSRFQTVIRFARGEISQPRLNTVFPAGFVEARGGPEVVGSASNQLLGKLTLARKLRCPVDQLRGRNTDSVQLIQQGSF